MFMKGIKSVYQCEPLQVAISLTVIRGNLYTITGLWLSL